MWFPGMDPVKAWNMPGIVEFLVKFLQVSLSNNVMSISTNGSKNGSKNFFWKKISVNGTEKFLISNPNV